VSYAIVLLARISSLMTRNPNPAVKHIGGAYSLGRLSVPLNVLGLIYLIFIAITCNFPTQSPATPANMNYTSAAVGIIMAIAGVTWITTGRKKFRGPESGGVMIGEEVVGIQPPIAVEVASLEQTKAEEL
jgi:choline transport protein